VTTSAVRPTRRPRRRLSIFLSSATQGLTDHRRAIERELGDVYRLYTWEPDVQPGRIVSILQQEVCRSRILLLLLGQHYGSTPPRPSMPAPYRERPDEALPSYTELEYDQFCADIDEASDPCTVVPFAAAGEPPDVDARQHAFVTRVFQDGWKVFPLDDPDGTALKAFHVVGKYVATCFERLDDDIDSLVTEAGEAEASTAGHDAALTEVHQSMIGTMKLVAVVALALLAAVGLLASLTDVLSRQNVLVAAACALVMVLLSPLLAAVTARRTMRRRRTASAETRATR
jgi:hypothetical protein